MINLTPPAQNSQFRTATRCGLLAPCVQNWRHCLAKGCLGSGGVAGKSVSGVLCVCMHRKELSEVLNVILIKQAVPFLIIHIKYGLKPEWFYSPPPQIWTHSLPQLWT